MIQDIPIPDISLATRFNARSLPTFVGYLSIVLSLLLICLPNLFGASREPNLKPATIGVSKLALVQLMAFVGMMLIYSFTIERVGFVIPTVGFLWGGACLLSAPHRGYALLVAIGISLGFWWVMTGLINIHLPGFIWPSSMALGD